MRDARPRRSGIFIPCTLGNSELSLADDHEIPNQADWRSDLAGGANDDVGGRVREGIWRSKTAIALHCISTDYDYDVQLTSKDGLHFEGRFSDKSNTNSVVANATLYENSEGIVLVGRWIEDGSEYRWWAELRKVKRFPHERA